MHLPDPAGPRVPGGLRLRRVHVPSRGREPLAPALEPDFASPTDFTYQSRPLHIGLAALLGRVLQPVAGLAIPPDALFQGRTPVRRFAGAYVAYVLLNVGLLVAAAVVLHDALIGRVWDTARETAALLAALAFMILSPTVKAWLFTPHTILWGVVIPLWALAAGRRILTRTAPVRASVPLCAGVASGIAGLAYGYAVLVPAVSILAVGMRLGVGDAARDWLVRWLRVATAAVALFGVAHARMDRRLVRCGRRLLPARGGRVPAVSLAA